MIDPTGHFAEVGKYAWPGKHWFDEQTHADDVADTQSFLTRKGFLGLNGGWLTIEGDYGPNTRFAHESYFLMRYTAPWLGQNHEPSVSAFQQLLNVSGGVLKGEPNRYNVGAVDGLYGPQTRMMNEKFLADYNAIPDGLTRITAYVYNPPPAPPTPKPAPSSPLAPQPAHESGYTFITGPEISGGAGLGLTGSLTGALDTYGNAGLVKTIGIGAQTPAASGAWLVTIMNTPKIYYLKGPSLEIGFSAGFIKGGGLGFITSGNYKGVIISMFPVNIAPNPVDAEGHAYVEYSLVSPASPSMSNKIKKYIGDKKYWLNRNLPGFIRNKINNFLDRPVFDYSV